MTNNKYRISFEVTDNWMIDGFRNFIKVLLSDDNTFEVYIISNDDNTIYVNNVAKSLNIEQTHVIIKNFTDDKLKAIKDYNIDIHLDNLQSFVMRVDELTDTYGVLVTKNLNKFYLKPDYILVFDRLLTQINDEESQ